MEFVGNLYHFSYYSHRSLRPDSALPSMLVMMVAIRFITPVVRWFTFIGRPLGAVISYDPNSTRSVALDRGKHRLGRL